MRGAVFVGSLAWLISVGSVPARADEVRCAAMPALRRAGIPVEGPRTLSLAACGGYGYTEAQPSEGAGHHRLLGSLAMALRPTRVLALELGASGRYDNHPRDAQGDDDGWLGEPHLTMRFARSISPSFAMGAELRVRFPGGAAPSIQLDATTLDLIAMASLSAGQKFLWVVNTGLRLDQSDHAVDDPRRLRSGDRLALDLSDSHAVLLALGGAYSVGPVGLFAELSGDLLIASDAGFSESPLRAALGAHVDIADHWHLSLVTEASLSSRPNLSTDVLVPVEPRLSVIAGFGWALPLDSPAPPAEGEQLPFVLAPPPPSRASLEGRVLDESGAAIAGAQVTLHMVAPVEAGSSPPDDPMPVTVDASGAFTFLRVPYGRVHVVATADGYEDGSVDLVMEADQSMVTDLRLVRQVPPGQVRGLVRSFDGRVLSATITVDPLGLTGSTAADGTFQIDVPPGSYEVVIRADGYTEQRRPVTVEQQGVVILNADLHRLP